MIYNVGDWRFGTLTKKQKQVVKIPSRRQKDMRGLRKELRALMKRWSM